MNTSPSPKTPILSGKTAAIMAMVFLTIFALFTLLGGIDKSHRTRVESIQTTGK